MLNRKAKNKNKNFEMANLKGLGFGKDSEQWVGNCQKMVGISEEEKTNFWPGVMIWNVKMRMK